MAYGKPPLGNRGNDYWLWRLQKAGFTKLLAEIEEGKITVYEARKRAGWVKRKKPRTNLEILEQAWARATIGQRGTFSERHKKEIVAAVEWLREACKRELATRPGVGSGESVPSIPTHPG